MTIQDALKSRNRHLDSSFQLNEGGNDEYSLIFSSNASYDSPEDMRRVFDSILDGLISNEVPFSTVRNLPCDREISYNGAVSVKTDDRVHDSKLNYIINSTGPARSLFGREEAEVNLSATGSELLLERVLISVVRGIR